MMSSPFLRASGDQAPVNSLKVLCRPVWDVCVTADMPLQIRSADLTRDSAQIIGLFQRYLAPASNRRRFEWLYLEGPHGPARAWLAYDQESACFVGMAAAFPRNMTFDGKTKSGWVLGDFCMHERFRTLGPALQLQRACLEIANDQPSSFCYDFPSPSMMAIYKRLGIAPSGTLTRWASPLRAEARIEKLVRWKVLAHALGIPAAALLARRGWKGDKRAARLELHVGSCTDEFNVLNERVRKQTGVFTDRTAAYLNWRYLANPSAKYEILTARRAGMLVGYAVFSLSNEQGHVTDLCSIEEPALIAMLLAGTIEQLRIRNAQTVSMNAGNAHPWGAVFERVGFRKREVAPVVTYAPPNHSLTESGRPLTWHLMQGERDS